MDFSINSAACRTKWSGVGITVKRHPYRSYHIHSIRFEVGVARVELPVHQVRFHVHMTHEHEELANQTLLVSSEDTAAAIRSYSSTQGGDRSRADRTVTIGEIAGRAESCASEFWATLTSSSFLRQATSGSLPRQSEARRPLQEYCDRGSVPTSLGKQASFFCAVIGGENLAA